jgi:glycosyltransferase involved in cell wall biosynthesis
MIHELRPGDFDDGGALARCKERAVRNADHVICISESTRRDLLARYPLDERNVSVTHLGYSALHIDPAYLDGVAFRRFAFSEDIPYILYVGSRGGYKNFAGLLKAFASSGWLRKEFRILCFGSAPFTVDERAMIAQMDLSSHVHLLSGSDGLLAAAYKHASLFVYPSMYEGFGIPPLEAMSLGCPVACGCTSSLPEVVGDAAALFDPANPESMASVIESVLCSDESLAGYVSRGYDRVRMFSWEQCAMQTRDIYKQVV